MRRQDVVLIGVDGGATEVKAHAVACDDLARPTSFMLRPESAARLYQTVTGFAPLPVAEQLRQREAGRVEPSDAEVEQGKRWVAAAVEAVADVARQCGARRILVGIGMPGLKTPDARGICVVNNGPRIPDYLDAFTAGLSEVGLELAAPIAALGSDADYCGLGEEYAAEGRFRNVANAYYVGCGTGIADALKLRGRLVPFDAVQSWILKSWQIPSALGPTFERLVSAASLNRVYAHWRPRGAADTAAGAYPEAAAAAGDPLAATWLAAATLVLAELVFERLDTIHGGRPEAPHRGSAYAGLDPAHEYRGTLLDRVVIGQRLGAVYADPRYRDVFAVPFERNLAAFIAASGKVELAAAYLEDDAGAVLSGAAAPVSDGVEPGAPRAPRLRPGFVTASRLRAAPALGAAVAAAQAAARG